MNLKIRLPVWAAFWLSTLLALMSDPYNWDRGWEIDTTITFGVIGLCLGIAVLIMSGWTRRSIILVILGLIIGQWVFLQVLLVRVLFHFWGFAPFGGFAP